MNLIESPTLMLPSTTLKKQSVPRYGSYALSKTSALKGSFEVSFGGGTNFTIASSMSSMPIPAFALAGIACSASIPRISSISSFTLSTSADGRSILLITGIISRFWSIARYAFASVCASTPCVESTMSSAPSQAAKERDTSYEKST